MRIRAPVYGEGVKAELHESAAKVHSPVRAAEQQPHCPCNTEALKSTSRMLARVQVLRAAVCMLGHHDVPVAWCAPSSSLPADAMHSTS